MFIYKCYIFNLSDIETFKTFLTPHSEVLLDQYVLGGWHSDVDTVGRAERLHEYFLGLWVVPRNSVCDHKPCWSARGMYYGSESTESPHSLWNPVWNHSFAGECRTECWYHCGFKYWDGQALANSVDPDQSAPAV